MEDYIIMKKPNGDLYKLYTNKLSLEKKCLKNNFKKLKEEKGVCDCLML